MIGARLKLARKAAGLSLRALEARIQSLVSAQAIGKYERDLMMPSSRVLIAIAEALRVTPAYLLKHGDVQVLDVAFRKKALTSAKDLSSVRARLLEAIERYREVEAVLAIDGQWVSPRGFPRAVQGADDAEDAAVSLRRAWALGEDPVPNLCALLEERHLKVQALDLPEDVSGLHADVLAGHDEQIRVVVVNRKDAGERQRFTLAHELGHLVLKVPAGKSGEVVCQRFASAFLMPRSTVVREVGQRRHALPIRELFRLKALFGVSAQAVAYRCRDLNIISQAVFVSVFRQFSTRGWRAQEPNQLEAERPLRFERLVIRALAENAIGESKAAELLGVPTYHLIDMLDTPPSADDDVEPACF